MKIDGKKKCSNAYFGVFKGGGHFWRVTQIKWYSQIRMSMNVQMKFDFKPPTLLELDYIVKEYSDDMSSCLEGLNMRMCKCMISAIPDFLLLLYANSMYEGIFPSEWAIADVALLPNTGDLTDPGNWRPISNTNIFSKILEKLVQRQLSNYIFAIISFRNINMVLFQDVQHMKLFAKL